MKRSTGKKGIDYFNIGANKLQIFPPNSYNFKVNDYININEIQECILDNFWYQYNYKREDKNYMLSILNSLAEYFHILNKAGIILKNPENIEPKDLYVVFEGKLPGIFISFEEIKAQMTNSINGMSWKKYSNISEALTQARIILGTNFHIEPAVKEYIHKYERSKNINSSRYIPKVDIKESYSSTTHEILTSRLSFKTNQTLSCLGPDIQELIWEKYQERQMKVFSDLQEYFLYLYEGRGFNPSIKIVTFSFPLLHCNDIALFKPYHRFIILRAEIDLKYFTPHNLVHKNISLQGMIDQGLVHSIYGTLDQILQSDLGIAIKETCKRLSSFKGKYKIIFYSTPPKFTPPIRPAIHDVYILKSIFLSPRRNIGILSEEQKETFLQNTNHNNWRYFKEAMEIDESIYLDTNFQMIFQNKIMNIWCGGTTGFLYRGVGRIIKPDYGEDTQIRREYRQLLGWYSTEQPEEDECSVSWITEEDVEID